MQFAFLLFYFFVVLSNNFIDTLDLSFECRIKVVFYVIVASPLETLKL